jgi:hypothetical protein
MEERNFCAGQISFLITTLASDDQKSFDCFFFFLFSLKFQWYLSWTLSLILTVRSSLNPTI